jgi:hypothetical protein
MLANEQLASHACYHIADGPPVDAIQFAATVIYKDSDKQYSKRRYFSVQERKIASAAAKQYDKRYVELSSEHDGTPEAIYRILTPDYADGMQAYAYAEAIREWLQAQPTPKGYMDTPGVFLKWFEDREKASALHAAYRACKAACQAHKYRKEAEDGIERFKSYYLPRPTEAETVAAETVAAE